MITKKKFYFSIGLTLSVTLLITITLFMVYMNQATSFYVKQIPLKKTTSKKSYAMGYLLGNNIKKIEKTLKVRAFLMGIHDSLNNKPSFLNTKDLARTQRPLTKKQKQKGQKHMAEGKEFLEENSKKTGVKITASGLQYEVLQEGNGKNPSETNTVEVHYRGTLINGDEFDSSYKRNQTIKFPLNQVIKGWTEGLQLMKEGSKFKFYIPSELAYGANGAGNAIPPHATLIFEVELIKVL